MTATNLIHRVGNGLYKFAFPIYRPLYGAFKANADRTERALLQRHIKSGAIVVDAGANIGIYSEFLAACVGPGGVVHSFEPDALNFSRLRAALSQRSNMRLNHAALGDRTGEMLLYVSKTLNVDHRTYPTSDEQRQPVSIQSTRLDDYFQPGERVDFIKMDIQGFELHALRGAKRILSDNPSIKLLLEFWPYGLRCAGSSGDELLALLRSSRFQCFLVADGLLTPSSDLNASPDDHAHYVNLFASRCPDP